MFGQKNENKKFKLLRLLEGDGIKSRLPLKIFSTLNEQTRIKEYWLWSVGIYKGSL